MDAEGNFLHPAPEKVGVNQNTGTLIIDWGQAAASMRAWTIDDA
jgi:hypothetical protein